MRLRRKEGEYLQLARERIKKDREFLKTWADPLYSDRRGLLGMVVGLIGVGAGVSAVVISAAAIYRMLSPVGFLNAEFGERGGWLFGLLYPFVILVQAATFLAGVLSRRTGRWKWGLLALAPASFALPVGSLWSSFALGAGVAVALAPRSKSSLGNRVAAVVLVGTIGAAASALEFGGTSVAITVLSFPLIWLSDRFTDFDSGKRYAALFISMLVLGAGSLGAQVLVSRAYSFQTPPETLGRKEWIVCEGVTNSSCAAEAAARAGFPIAWLPRTEDAKAYAMLALGRRNQPPQYVLQELATPHGGVISVYSRPPEEPRGEKWTRTDRGLKITFWTEDVIALDNIGAHWQRQGETYSLNYLAHPTAEFDRDELTDRVIDLIRLIRYSPPE